MSYLQLLGRVTPEIIVVIAALVALAVDMVVMREEPLRSRFLIVSAFAAIGCVVAIIWLLVINPPAAGDAASKTVNASQMQSAFAGMFVDDALTRLIKAGLIALTLCTMVISLEGTFTEHVGEYVALVLIATAGMMLLVSSTDLLMIFISLELTSLSLYILTAFNKRSVKSAEAALKYFLFGGMSAAFTLFGLSLIYGLSGSTNLNAIADHLSGDSGALDPLLLVAIVMVAIGFGFKIAVVPFHLWAPDAYQGAPTPSAALIASGSKLASFFVFARVLMIGLAHATGNGAWHQYAAGWMPVLAIAAALSMVLGNFAAIVQRDVKRLLAYSAIAHAGYATLGLLSNNQQGLSSVIFYMITYGLTVIGAFGVVAVVEQTSGDSSLTGLAGLGRRDPLLAFCMLVFMLSLAGIPPLAGFFGKFYLFAAVTAAAPNLGWLWLVILAIATSAVSLYYYLQVLKQIYVMPARDEQAALSVPISSKLILCALALGVIALGCAPNLLLGRLLAAVQGFGF